MNEDIQNEKKAESTEQEVAKIAEDSVQESQALNPPNVQAESNININLLKSELLTAQIKVVLCEGGVRPDKLAWAVRLIDIDKVAPDGVIDAEAMTGAINRLLTEFPQWKNDITGLQTGFKIGADINRSGSDNNSLDQIFGIRK